jgi:hypothetical protein
MAARAAEGARVRSASLAQRVLLALACAALLPAAAFAQDVPAGEEAPGPRPIGLFAADVRAAFPSYDQDAESAGRLGVTQANLPGRGFGLVFGAHVYPLRLGRTTVGIGGEVLRSRGSQTLEPEDEGEPSGPTVRTRFSSVAPQVSLNFGARQGWSYVSAGMGWARYSVEREDPAQPEAEDAPRRRTLNYGGGARWFAREHVAFALDIRFYSLSAQEASGTHPALPAMRRLVLSAGVAFK